LGYRLKTGEQVDILTAKRGGPSRDWLNPDLGYVKTARARQKIRQWFRRRDREESITQGRAQLERELKRLSLGSTTLESIAKRFNYDKLDDFLAAIGYGDINSHHVGTKLLEEERAAELAATEEAKLKEVAPSTTATSDVQVKGVGNLLTQLARCCNPVPGDEIVGYITRGRGVSIHRKDCPNILSRNDPERLISVGWERTTRRDTYPVKVNVRAWDRGGLLRDIAAVVADEDVSMSAANVTTRKQDNLATFSATLEINGIAQLSRLLAKIEQLPNVLEARRQVS
jgi:GTP pyrophosphokinase